MTANSGVSPQRNQTPDAGTELREEVRLVIDRVIGVQIEKIRLVAQGRVSEALESMLDSLEELEAQYLARIARLESDIACQGELIRQIGESSASAERDLRRLAAGLDRHLPRVFPFPAATARPACGAGRERV